VVDKDNFVFCYNGQTCVKVRVDIDFDFDAEPCVYCAFDPQGRFVSAIFPFTGYTDFETFCLTNGQGGGEGSNNFFPATSNPMCGSTLFYCQEV